MEDLSIGRECISLINSKLNKLISPDEYYIYLINLNNKYILESRDTKLSLEDLSDYKQKNITNKYSNVYYLGDIEPVNFREAAEMYARHRAKVDQESHIFLPEKKYRLDRKSIASGEKDEVPF